MYSDAADSADPDVQDHGILSLDELLALASGHALVEPEALWTSIAELRLASAHAELPLSSGHADMP